MTNNHTCTQERHVTQKYSAPASCDCRNVQEKGCRCFGITLQTKSVFISTFSISIPRNAPSAHGQLLQLQRLRPDEHPESDGADEHADDVDDVVTWSSKSVQNSNPFGVSPFGTFGASRGDLGLPSCEILQTPPPSMQRCFSASRTQLKDLVMRSPLRASRFGEVVGGWQVATVK